MVVGPLLAGLAVKYLPTQGVVAIDSITFLVGSLIVMSVTLNENHIKKQRREHSYFKQMKDGLAYVGKRHWIILLSCSYAFYNGGNSLEAVVRPFLVKDQLGLGVDTLGYILSAGSFGALLISAALLRIKLKGHKLNYVILAILVRGAGVALLSTATNFPMLVIIMFVSTLPGPLLTINNNAFYQNEVPSEYMGRVFAVRSFVSTLAMPIGALFGSTFLKYFGISGSFVATGLIIMLGAGSAFLAKQMHDKLEKEQKHNHMKACT